MKFLLKRNIAITLLAAASLSCAKESLDMPSLRLRRGSGEVTFTAALGDAYATRSDYGTASFDIQGETAEMEYFMLPMPVMDMGSGDGTKGAPATSVYSSFRFADLNSTASTTWTATDGGSGTYNASGIRYEDFDDDMSFACWAPVDADGLSYDGTNGRLHYETPTDVTDQADIIVATASATPEDEDPLDVTFSHILGGIQIRTGDILPNAKQVSGSYQVSVQSVTIRNVYGEGNYDFSTGAWTVDTSASIDVALTNAASVFSTDNVGTVASPAALNDGEYTALLIPQSFPSNAYVEVVANTMTFRIPLSGITLPKGSILTLSANGRDYYLLEGTATGAFNFDGYAVSADVIDDNGEFSVLVPVTLSTSHSISDAAITSITHLPGSFCKYTTIRFAGANIVSIDCSNIRSATSLSFQDCTSLTTLTNLNTSTVTNFSNSFRNCTSLTTIPAIDTSSGTDFRFMFSGCTSLTTIPAIDTQNGIYFSDMFSLCSALTSVPALSTSNGTTFKSMFSGCTSLTAVPYMDTARGTSFEDFVRQCSSLTSFPSINTGEGTTFKMMFYHCTSLTTVPALNTAKGGSFYGMFAGCTALTSAPAFNTSLGTNFNSMFYGCSSLVSVAGLQTGNGTDFKDMFMNCTLLTTVPASMDLSSATTVYRMFANCSSFTTAPAISNSSGVSTFYGMFYNCTSLTSVSLFDTSGATNFGSMFQNCRALTSIPLFNLSSGSSFSQMFSGCSGLVSIPAFNTGNATNFQDMFYNCSSLATVPASLNTSRATNLYRMFYGCRALTVAPAMDTSSCTNFVGLFNGCTSLTTIPALDVSSGTQLGSMLNSCTSLTTMGGLIGYGTNSTSLDVRHCPLTHDSAVNIINTLASRDIDGYVVGTLYFNATTKATLTADEIAVATGKNWTIN